MQRKEETEMELRSPATFGKHIAIHSMLELLNTAYMVIDWPCYFWRHQRLHHLHLYISTEVKRRHQRLYHLHLYISTEVKRRHQRLDHLHVYISTEVKRSRDRGGEGVKASWSTCAIALPTSLLQLSNVSYHQTDFNAFPCHIIVINPLGPRTTKVVNASALHMV